MNPLKCCVVYNSDQLSKRVFDTSLTDEGPPALRHPREELGGVEEGGAVEL